MSGAGSDGGDMETHSKVHDGLDGDSWHNKGRTSVRPLPDRQGKQMYQEAFNSVDSIMTGHQWNKVVNAT